MTAAMTDRAPSPWWPCPECGGIDFRALVMFERGKWSEYGDTWEAFVPARGEPTTVGISDVICDSCGWRGDLDKQYGWLGAGS